MSKSSINIFEYVVNEVGFAIDIIICIFTLYLLIFKRRSLNKVQKTIVIVVFIGSIIVLGLFIYLIIASNSIPNVEPLPIEYS